MAMEIQSPFGAELQCKQTTQRNLIGSCLCKETWQLVGVCSDPNQ